MKLAIVIPAYKIDFFDKTLASFEKQSNKKFTIYVGDDCSPYNIKAVCDKYGQSLNLIYYRFDSNLGKTDLVGQWERCVKNINNEEWIWLFSDDDIADKECVASFYGALELTNSYFDVYRFNTRVINSNDATINEAKESPDIENAMSLAYNILLGKRGNSMPDHIFKRSKYNELSGFVNFMHAQASDWATSINYAYENGLYTISGPKVGWRYSGSSISSNAFKNKARLIPGHLQFIRWINKKFNKIDEEKYKISIEEIKIASICNLANVLEFHYRGIPAKQFFKILFFVSKNFNFGLYKAGLFCIKINARVYRKYLRVPNKI